MVARTAPKWLRTFVHTPAVETIPVCVSCGRVALGRDMGFVLPRRYQSRRRVSPLKVCRCAAAEGESARLTLARFLPEVPTEGDGPRVTWKPELPAGFDIRADGQGGVIFYQRSKTTLRMVEVHRIPPLGA